MFDEFLDGGINQVVSGQGCELKVVEGQARIRRTFRVCV